MGDQVVKEGPLKNGISALVNRPQRALSSLLPGELGKGLSPDTESIASERREIDVVCELLSPRSPVTATQMG